MYSVLKYIGDHFSGYVVFLTIISVFMMVVLDRARFKRVGLNKEARYSFVFGLIEAAVVIVLLIAKLFAPVR